MRAMFYTGDLTMEMRQVDEPEAQPGESIVDIHSCGICGSDMHAYHGKDERRIPPLILGHEAVGTVRSGPLEGRRVAVNPLVTCGHCQYCLSGRQHLCGERQIISMKRPGAFAEVLAMPNQNLWPIPERMDFATAALMEPLAVAVHTVELLARYSLRPLAEGRVVVLGGGAIGLLSALVLQHYGVRDLWVAEPNALRRRALENVLDAKLYDPSGNPPETASVDGLVDAVGAGLTRKAAVPLLRNGAFWAHVGLENNEPGLDTRAMTLREIGMIGCYCYSNADIRSALSLLERGLCSDWSWCEQRGLADGPQSFEDIHNGKAPPKIVLNM